MAYGRTRVTHLGGLIQVALNANYDVLTCYVSLCVYTKPEWTSTDLYKAIVYNDENDWARFDHGRELTKKKFTQLLSEFGIRPKKRQKANVFYVSDLEEAFKKYLPPI